MSPREKLQQFDLFGTALFIPGITCLLLALQWGGTTYAWSSWRVILLLVIFAVLSVFWAITQIKRGNHATLPPHIISQRSIAFGAFYIFCLGSASLVFTYYLPLWFQAIKNASPIGSGVDFIPTAIAAGICSILGGFIVSVSSLLRIKVKLIPYLIDFRNRILRTTYARWFGALVYWCRTILYAQSKLRRCLVVCIAIKSVSAYS